MPIREETPPPEAVNMARLALRNSARRLQSIASLAADEAAPPLGAAYRVFVAGLQDVQEGALLERARPVGWQFFVSAGTPPIATIEVPADASRQSSNTFNHVNRGPHVTSIYEGARVLSERTEVIGGALRLLRIPALYTLCLWLHTDNDVDELFPIPPAPRELEPGRSYSEDELTERLVAVIQARELSSRSAPLRETNDALRSDNLKAP